MACILYVVPVEMGLRDGNSKLSYKFTLAINDVQEEKKSENDGKKFQINDKNEDLIKSYFVFIEKRQSFKTEKGVEFLVASHSIRLWPRWHFTINLFADEFDSLKFRTKVSNDVTLLIHIRIPSPPFSLPPVYSWQTKRAFRAKLLPSHGISDERNENVFLFRFSISKSAIKYGELKQKHSMCTVERRANMLSRLVRLHQNHSTIIKTLSRMLYSFYWL